MNEQSRMSILWRSKRTATERLEDGLLDDTVVIDLDLQLHDVSTCGSTDETGSDIEILLVERANLWKRKTSAVAIRLGRRRSDDGGSSRKTEKAWLVGLVDDAFAGSGGRY